MWDIFPAISYSPETKLTLGAIGIYNLDLTKNRKTSPSNIQFLAVYTTAKQVALESKWEIFSNGDQRRFRGEFMYNKYPDRNYGIGNQANCQVREYNEDKQQFETHNYLSVKYDFIYFAPIVMQRIKPDLYLGLSTDFEHVWGYGARFETFTYLNADSVFIQGLPVSGTKAGVGVQAIFDSRDYILNPLNGYYIELTSMQYGRFLGSEFAFHLLRLDARSYIQVKSNQVFVARMMNQFRFGNESIPMRGLSRVGGKDFVRGYFKGTYQDRHMSAFELEYRIPFWRKDVLTPFWKIWKRLGLVAFVSGAQVYNDQEGFAFDRFHLAVGTGIRILFNPETRVNLRFDYAIGLSKNSDGTGQRQSGFYFFLGEAF